MRNASPGNTLSEYGFVLTLVGVAAIGALVLLGGNLNTMLGSMGTGLVEQGSFEAMALGTNPPAGNANANNPSLTTNPDGTVTARFDMGNGHVITLPNYPADLSRSIQTSGASGTTDLIAGSIRQMAEQLLASGEIDADQHQSLLDLANAGHLFGKAHKYLEDSYSACQADSTSPACSFGITLTDPEMVAHVPPNPYGTGYGYPIVGRGLETDGAYQDKLQAAYDSALARGALDNPQVKQVVDALRTQISDMGNQMSSLALGQWTDNRYQGRVIDFKAEMARRYKEQSHLNAASICHVGGDQDSGVHCQAG